MSESAKSTWGLILTVLGLALTIWLQWDGIKEKFRARDKSILEKLISDVESPDYIQRHCYLRNRDALIGFAIMAVIMCLAALTFTAMYPTVNRSLTEFAVLFQLFLGYVACLCFLSAIAENKRGTATHVQARLDKLKRAYEKYKGPERQS